MFSHKAFLKLGDYTGSDFMSLVKSGYELADCEFSFQQGMDDVGKASTEVFGGTLSLILPMLPPDAIIEWALDSRKYQNGAIVVLDEHNQPNEKIFFKNTACIHMNVTYTLKGKSYIMTSLILQAEELRFGSGLDFSNYWTK